MAKKKVQGFCCICGKYGPLTEEHVPPQKAFNDFTIVEYSWNELTTKAKSKGKKVQGGVKGYTLCEKCNNDTGSWYGNEYVKWARTCSHLLATWNQRKVSHDTICLLNVYPLRFVKQVLTCFFSLLGAPSGAGLAKMEPRLVSFILDKQNTILPPGFRFFINLYSYSVQGNTSLRRWMLAAKIPTLMDSKGNIVPLDASTFNEIAHPPFQLVMTLDDEPFKGATEITGFKYFGYDEQTNLEIALRIVSSESPYPGAG